MEHNTKFLTVKWSSCLKVVCTELCESGVAGIFFRGTGYLTLGLEIRPK